MVERILSDELLDRFERFAMTVPSHSRRAWERYFETLLIEAGEPVEARVLKGVFRHAERRIEGLADPSGPTIQNNG